MIHTIDDLINKTNSYESKMTLDGVEPRLAFTFSNSIKGSEAKLFEISLNSLHQTLVDINNHFSDFEAISTYAEKKWRDAIRTFFTDKVAQTLAATQTNSFFIVINKLLTAVNDLEFDAKKIPLTETNLENAIQFLEEQILSSNTSISITPPYVPVIIATSKTTHTKAGENFIYYGAPGTGKSHEIDQRTDEDNSVRTVFHPETQYSDFVGCLKPSMNNDGIEYSFKHGPFIEALVKALKDPDHHYYLIIEEINRAPAAAVFGELFQLLDRDPAGQSKYKIDINDRDLLTLLTKELSVSLLGNKLYIPENLSIYATMNSSDQAVMPLDTAFKRRWKFEYKPLDFTTSPLGNFELNTQDGPQTVSWSDFAQVVNSILSSESIPEDRHMGPWFVNENEIKDPEDAKKALTGKILMYLWDDVLRHSERSVLFHQEIKTFGSLVKKFNAGEIIFSENFEKRLKEETGK
ncbi:McrB family protein [Acinetobacter pittii]|uniref:McrB family protein n=1 Tax=Acinetobacter pittii TaxID=48296 RepID=UPI0039F578FE